MQQEAFSRSVEDLVYLASCAVNGEVPDPARAGGMDLESLYRIADWHMMTAVAASALEAAGIREPAFIEAKAKAIRKAVLLDADLRTVTGKLEANGIWYMPLKGVFLKDYYPSLGMRQMTDQDLLIDADRLGDADRIMKELSFQKIRFESSNEDVYQKPPVSVFEIHTALFSRQTAPELYACYRNVKDRLVRDEGSQFGYHFTPEDFYVYLIAHAWKHCRETGGTGLRTLLDIYLYRKREKLDEEYIGTETDRLGITGFEQKIRSLSMHLYAGEEIPDEEREMLSYIASSGVYGTMQNLVEAEIREKGRWGYFFSKLFLPAEKMREKYPVLEKAPVLFPVLWVYRLVYGIFRKHGRLAIELKAVLVPKGKETGK